MESWRFNHGYIFKIHDKDCTDGKPGGAAWVSGDVREGVPDKMQSAAGFPAAFASACKDWLLSGKESSILNTKAKRKEQKNA